MKCLMSSVQMFFFFMDYFLPLVKNNAARTLQKLYSDSSITLAVLGFVPLVYIIVVVLHHLIRRFRGQKGGDGLTSSLPHRLLHSDQYQDSFGYIAAFSVQSQ